MIPIDPLYKIDISQNVTFKTYTLDKVNNGSINTFQTSALIDNQTVMFTFNPSALSTVPSNG